MYNIADIETGQKYLYEHSRNIEEEIVNKNGTECYLFFSSNGLYSIKTIEEFEQSMLSGNRYEWKSIATSIKKRKNIGKIIYVRDIWLNHYREGVNSSLSSIEKVIDHLRECVKGYALTTVGISSGGYMAVIAGCELHAKRVFCISGQFDLNKHLKTDNLSVFRHKNPKYCQLVDLIINHDDIPIYYFCPVNCSHDFENYKLVQNIKNVKCFLFPDKKHAATVYPFNFPDLLCLSNKKLNKLEEHYHEKTINKNIFLLRTISWKGTFEFVKRAWHSKLNMENLKALWDVKK